MPFVKYVNNQPLLVIYKKKMIHWKPLKYSESKSMLTFKYGNFIEYNENPKQNKVTKIEFNTTGCFGTCPKYKLILNRDSLSIFKAERYNFSDDEIKKRNEEGVFSTLISEKEFDKLEEIINYCAFENLNDEYHVMHTDDQTGILKITFNDGNVKTINDYGMVGTYGLKLFYEKLAEFRFNEKWLKIEQ